MIRNEHVCFNILLVLQYFENNVLFQDSFPSSKVIIQTYSQISSGADQMDVFVDEDIKLLRIEITGTSNTNEVDIKDPSGTKIL